MNTLDGFEVIYYETPNGDCPVFDFIQSLEPKMAARVIGFIDLLSERGNTLREPYSKSLEDGIFELRIQSGNDISRVLYFFYVGKKIILTHGFIKKTRKTPPQEIEKAKKYRKAYNEQEGLS